MIDVMIMPEMMTVYIRRNYSDKLPTDNYCDSRGGDSGGSDGSCDCDDDGDGSGEDDLLNFMRENLSHSRIKLE